MILVKRYTGGKVTFRTSRGTVTGQLINGYVAVHVDPFQGKALRAVHKFHAPPAGFSLDAPVKEVKKEAPVAKKKTTKKKSTAKK